MSGRAARRLLRRCGTSAGPVAVPALVNRVLARPGQPLDAATRAHFEPRFGHDLSGVRIHADAEAGRSAAAVGAEAYAYGGDIAFAPGRHAPSTVAGRALMAHELAHVVQAPDAASPARLVGGASDPAEGEADGMAAAALSGAPVPAAAGRAASGTIHRQLGAGLTDADQSEAFSVSMSNGLTLAGFGSDSAELTDDHRDRIVAYKAKITELLKTWPDSFVSIVGHTDATDTEAHNQDLGQRRADAVVGALGTGGAALPGALMRASSLGESAPAIASKGREAANRRVEVFFNARRNFKLPPMAPSQPWTPIPHVDVNPGGRVDIGPGPGLPAPIPRIPQTLPERRNWVKDYLDRDKAIRELPKWAQDKVRDALADIDEVAADKVIDALPLAGKEKAAVKAVAKTILQLLKGKKPNMQEPSPYQMPPSRMPEFQQLPGTKIFPLKEWTF